MSGAWAKSGRMIVNASGNPIECASCPCGSPATCGCSGNSNPRVAVTMSWTDTGVTSVDWLGCTWTNGETRIVCPDYYNNSGGRELWMQYAGGTGMSATELLMLGGGNVGSASPAETAIARLDASHFLTQANRTFTAVLSSTSNVLSVGRTVSLLTPITTYVVDNLFHSVTFDRGGGETLTISWTRVAGTGCGGASPTQCWGASA